MAQISDEELFKRFQEGDVDSFERLYYRYRGRLYSYILSIVGSRHDADEVLQEVFAAIVRMRAEPLRGRFRNLVFLAGRNRAIDVIRRRKAAGRMREAARDRLVALRTADAAHDAARREEEEVLGHALFELSRGEREAVMLKVYSGFTFQEISDLTETPLSTVASRYQAALGKLREKVGAYTNEP